MAVVITGTTITAPDGALDAADLTGDLDASLLTGTLPALDGSALTGVGGATTQLVAPTDFSGVTSLTISLPTGYTQHTLKFTNLSLDGISSEVMLARFGQADGTLRSGSVYAYSHIVSGTTSVQNQDYAPYIIVGNRAGGASNSVSTGYNIKIFDADSTVSPAYLEHSMFRSSGSGSPLPSTGAGGVGTIERNANIQLYYNNSPAFSGTYELWGVSP